MVWQISLDKTQLEWHIISLNYTGPTNSGVLRGGCLVAAIGCAHLRRAHICALGSGFCQVGKFCQAKCQPIGEHNSQILAKIQDAKSNCQTVGEALSNSKIRIRLKDSSVCSVPFGMSTRVLLRPILNTQSISKSLPYFTWHILCFANF